MTKGEIKKISFTDIYTPYQKEYTAITTRRSMPQDGTLPDGLATLIQAVTLNCENLTEPSVAYGEMAKVDKMEESMVHANLARISSAPFPLVESVIVESDSNLDKGKDFPIKDIATGKIKAKRYTRVKMSKLGNLLTRHYKRTSLAEFRNNPFHKSIVPVSLLRPGKPITLGYSSTWLPLNPRELFLLMIKMIEHGTPFIPYRDIEDIFKGPDVGYGYNIRCTNESLATLYQNGKGTFTITPEIAIDREEKTITFKKPPLDSTSIELRDYLRKQVRENVYHTFLAEVDDIKLLGVEVVISNVTFLSPAEDIYDEITGDKRNYITKQVVSTNTISRRSSLQKDGYKESIYEIDIPHIPETLWTSIIWEMEKVKEDILRQIKEETEALWAINLMRKLTYDLPMEYDIRNVIHETLKISGGVTRRKNAFRKVLQSFTYHPDVPEEMRGFSDEEIDEIFKAKNNDVLATMHDSNDWVMIYNDAVKKIHELHERYNDDQGILASIKQELEHLTKNPDQWRRKSKVYFDSSEAIMPRDILIPSREFDQMNLPVTYYYDHFKIAKSYGRNMNIIASEGELPVFALNATTKDLIYLYTKNQALVVKPQELENRFTNVGQGNFIRGVLPFPNHGEKLMVAIIIGTDSEGRPIVSYIIVDSKTVGSIPFNLWDAEDIGFYSTIVSWSYIEPGKYMDMMYPRGIIRIPTDELLENQKGEDLGYLPEIAITSLADISMVDSPDTEITIPTLTGFTTETPEVSNMKKVKMMRLDHRSIVILGNHYEMYLGKTYIPDPTEIYLTLSGEAVDIKKVSIPEYTPIKGATDKKTQNIISDLKNEVIHLSEAEKEDFIKVPRVKSFTTSQHMTWTVNKYQPYDSRL